jgi:phage/plasmid-like protein (TIGR03299 family)
MAHQIENNQFVYVGEKAWHGLGTEVAKGTTGQQMLVTAGLNFKIQTRALAMRDAFGTPDKMLKDPLKEFRAVVRADNDHVFQVVSNRWKPVQNEEIANFFREFCEAGHADMETLGSLRDGAVIWALAKLRVSPGSASTILNNDKLTAHLLLATSHDGSLKTIAKGCQERVVCGNTLGTALGERTATYSLKHSSTFGPVQREQAKQVMGMAIEQAEEMNAISSRLASVNIDNDDWLEFMAGVIGKDNVFEATKQATDTNTAQSARSSFLDQIIEAQESPLSRVAREIQEATMSSPGSDLASAKGTLWGALNGVTYYVDHAKKTRGENGDSNRLFSAWFGQGETMKRKALEVAVEMAGISQQTYQRS